jgi:hypothetical protein
VIPSFRVVNARVDMRRSIIVPGDIYVGSGTLGDHFVKLSGGRRIAALVIAAVLATAGVLVAALGVPSFEASSFVASPSSAPTGEVAVAQGLGPTVLKNATECRTLRA